MQVIVGTLEGLFWQGENRAFLVFDMFDDCRSRLVLATTAHASDRTAFMVVLKNGLFISTFSFSYRWYHEE